MNSSLDSLLSTLSQQLLTMKIKLVTAESCTGGGLSYYLTSLAGSSAWFERGFVTYSNEAKMDLLDVKPDTLETCGAVSIETAIEMAEGALKASRAAISISITGIAGPDGGTPSKPVGTVCIAIASQHAKTSATLNHFSGDRDTIRTTTIHHSIQALLHFLQAHPQP